MIDFDALVIAPCHDAFGEPVVYTQAGKPAITVSGVFDEGYLSVAGEGGAVEMSTTLPVCGIRAAQLGFVPKQGDKLVRSGTGVRYEVKDFHPDGKGEIKLILGKLS